jgi:hypothetical protein
MGTEARNPWARLSKLLQEWDFRITRENNRSTIFEAIVRSCACCLNARADLDPLYIPLAGTTVCPSPLYKNT